MNYKAVIDAGYNSFRLTTSLKDYVRLSEGKPIPEAVRILSLLKNKAPTSHSSVKNKLIISRAATKTVNMST